MTRHRIFLSLTLYAASIFAFAIDPMATSYTYDECRGSLSPYPTIEKVATPDTLTAVMINHVGRHGSRYPASASNCKMLLNALNRADSAKTITNLGREMKVLVGEVMEASQNQWGALDSLGESEQRGIASRMYMAYPKVFENASIKAYSSYSPRAMMSMYAFTHQLDRLSNRMEFYTVTGRVNDKMLRPFDVDQAYIDFRKEPQVIDAYDKYYYSTCPLTAIERVLGRGFPYNTDMEAYSLAMAEYYVIAGMSAMSMPYDAKRYFTVEEMNALWSCFNLRQYLQRTATTISQIPAEIASDLLQDMISTTEDYIDGKSKDAVVLRFGHAETLMPLFSLMRLKGCYYMTNYFDTVAQHWKDFYVVPMAANLQMVLFKNTKGKYYVRIDLNEVPVPLIPNRDDVYIPWDEARDYLSRCIYGV